MIEAVYKTIKKFITLYTPRSCPHKYSKAGICSWALSFKGYLVMNVKILTSGYDLDSITEMKF